LIINIFDKDNQYYLPNLIKWDIVFLSKPLQGF